MTPQLNSPALFTVRPGFAIGGLIEVCFLNLRGVNRCKI